MSKKKLRVAVIGASDKPDRYAYKAMKLLAEKGHVVYPVHHRIPDIEGIPVYSKLQDIEDVIDTVTLYVGKTTSTALLADILACHPQRIVFNPGAENPDLEKQAQKAGVETVRGCTLVMLKTGQF